VLDTLIVVFILYFTAGQYGAKIAELGLTGANFGKNLFYGMVGYIATVPVLAAVLALTAYVTNMMNYVPERQAVVELFLKEKDTAFLLFTSLFAAIAGPIIEELFFRGFLYNAVKKYAGILTATIVSAVFFASVHAHAVGFAPILVLGIVLAYLYEKTGSLVSSMTMHAVHNLSMVSLVFLIKQFG
jgi:membrane protease YdiL (CAAX protease family)